MCYVSWARLKLNSTQPIPQSNLIAIQKFSRNVIKKQLWKTHENSIKIYFIKFNSEIYVFTQLIHLAFSTFANISSSSRTFIYTLLGVMVQHHSVFRRLLLLYFGNYSANVVVSFHNYSKLDLKCALVPFPLSPRAVEYYTSY